ncbi:hypothetical protein F5Y16DRAFT_63512 [Xylariaceae sp. FL0255]|nr:hypothetical protein F5Y16DRAFT_63512 [Xylariaceae sp. FL0255]
MHNYNNYSFVGDGDGTRILDHQVCILADDLGYCISNIPRGKVIDSVKQGNLQRLLDCDELLRSLGDDLDRRCAPSRSFRSPSHLHTNTFVDSDDFFTTTSLAKNTTPAWSDRRLLRGAPDVVHQLDYRSFNETRASRHRPVSAIQVKKADPEKRATALDNCQRRLQNEVMPKAVAEARALLFDTNKKAGRPQRPKSGYRHTAQRLHKKK